MARKAIYTPEERKQRQRQQSAQWQKENMTSINVRLLPVDKARYEAYAAHKGLPVARMLRESAERCMVEDGWREEEGKTGEGEEMTENAGGKDIKA